MVHYEPKNTTRYRNQGGLSQSVWSPHVHKYIPDGSGRDSHCFHAPLWTTDHYEPPKLNT